MRWPPGVASSGTHCGIKSDGSFDLGMIVADEPVAWAGVFTRNAAAASPVRWCRSEASSRTRAIVVNSGNANACTGQGGDRAVRATVATAGAEIGCREDEVLVASTGPIGVALPVERITDALPACLASLSDDVEPFARSILTTDTRTKTARAGEEIGVAGVAKGAAMIAPSMATMLAFLVTDARVEDGDLREALLPAVTRTFNRISVDACESTNDSVFLLATGRGPRVTAEELAGPVSRVCGDLATQIVRDAEGGSRLVRISVSGAGSEDEAAAFGRAVAASALWRCAVNGGDPNWGRVAAALGAHDRSLSVDRLTIHLGEAAVFVKGEPTSDHEAARSAMAGDEIVVACELGSGPGSAEVLTSDLSTEYVKLNSEGTS